MLVALTYKCEEQCSHCLVDARPDREEMMSPAVFRDVISFTKQCLGDWKNEPMLLSGGEPTLHPRWAQMVQILCEEGFRSVILLSNGSFARDKGLMDKVAELKRKWPSFAVQVRTHPKYYPNYRSTMANKAALEALGCYVFDDAVRIIPLGRAKNMEREQQFPSCRNFHLIMTQLKPRTFGQLWRLMRMHSPGDFCKPYVLPNGDLRIGESSFCWPVGSIYTTEKQLIDTVKDSLAWCNACGGKPVLFDFMKKRGL